MYKIKIDDEVKDELTGFTGTVISVTDWKWGCRHIGVQPVMIKDGTFVEMRHFDEPRLKLVKKLNLPKKKSDKGGIISANPIK